MPDTGRLGGDTTPPIYKVCPVSPSQEPMFREHGSILVVGATKVQLVFPLLPLVPPPRPLDLQVRGLTCAETACPRGRWDRPWRSSPCGKEIRWRTNGLGRLYWTDMLFVFFRCASSISEPDANSEPPRWGLAWFGPISRGR